jgi:hypothetical protein
MNLAHHLAVVLSTTGTPNPHPGNNATAAGQAADPNSTLGDIMTALGPAGMALVLAMAAFALYVVSLSLHPNAKCNRCKGAGRHHGSVFSYAQRPCSSCKGRGVHPRLGRKFLFKQP